MGSLHQLLAVKKDTAQRANEIVKETAAALGSKHLFNGAIRKYTPFDEEGQKFPDEHEQMSYTVGEKLAWFARNFGRHMDVEFQIEKANQGAFADVVVDGLSLHNVPATYLLDLTDFLEKIRRVYAGMPVLDPKNQWEKDYDAGPGVFTVTEPEISYRTQKVLSHKVLYDATKEHPAQIEKWTEDAQVGKYEKRMWSGAVTPAQKASILTRIDELIAAVKKALSKANDTEHDNDTIAEKIFEYIHGDLPTEGIYKDSE